MRTHQPLAIAPPPEPEPRAPVSIEGVRSLLAGLDRRQRQAVTHGDGPLLVIAGPGTGKTEVITRRVAWLIASRRARSSEILALTFTERAADEMQGRVDLLLPYGQADTAIQTFHAFGDWLLREHGYAIGRAAHPRVIGRSEAIVLLRDRIFELGLERYRPLGDPTRFAGALVDLFSRAKEEGISPDDLAAYALDLEAGARAALSGSAEDAVGEAVAGLLDEAAAQAELASAFRAYQTLLLERSLIDHGDQVAEAVRLLQQRPAVRMALRRRFRYVVVDEAQDADPQQLSLVRHLVGAAGNVTFVGDDDQAIYSFRGAVGQGLAGLQESYPSLRDVVLRRNYRSRKTHPGGSTTPHPEQRPRSSRGPARRRQDAHGGAARATARAWSATTPISPPAMRRTRWLRTIQQRLAQGRPPGSMAVLVRTNRDAEPILASLDVRGIPRRFSGAAGLFAHRDVRDALSLMRVIACALLIGGSLRGHGLGGVRARGCRPDCDL